LFSSLLTDMLGYAGTEIVRRIVGFAHNADFESISNPDLRGDLEQRALVFARQLIVAPQGLHSLHSLLREARQQSKWRASR